ncbi:glycine zipper 2TM domain-containing protein [Rheinheimera sp.]|uniref:glycine zipper 2TM domain-containing protein n=1 Tax=Rheinheimera sp. TaxID=1869214 RepID=UPI0027B93CD2|nr:glycine zipper 2TM domain-containing protein [Rheinheimera sp.]
MKLSCFHPQSGAAPLVLCLCVVLTLTPLTGCSSQQGYTPQTSIRQQQQQDQLGFVRSIQLVDSGTQGLGSGALIGAVIGGVVGNQFGSGSGRKVATGAGLIGGALAGNEIQKRNQGGNQLYRVTVQLQNGQIRHFDYQDIGNLQIGDRVSIQGQQLYQL